jgi:hypothetical protein
MPIGKPKAMDDNYKLEPGMDNAQRDADKGSWEVPVEMLTKGRFVPLGDMSGPVVGSPYDVDPLGEDRERITFMGKGKK